MSTELSRNLHKILNHIEAAEDALNGVTGITDLAAIEGPLAEAWSAAMDQWREARRL